MATEHCSSSSTAAPPRRDHGRTTRSLRERLLAGLPVTERRLSLNGVTTAVLEGGEGAPVVLLHGPGAYAAHWLHIIPALATSHRVIAPDLPGHGESGMFACPLNPDLLSGWVEDLIDCTCAAPPVLVGSTLGGAIAARFAGNRCEWLAALVLVDALGLTEFRPTPEFGAAEVLSEHVGEHVRFEATSVTLPGVTRRFRSFRHAAREQGLSRVFGGIHFLRAVADGFAQGKAIGREVNRKLPPSRR